MSASEPASSKPTENRERDSGGGYCTCDNPVLHGTEIKSTVVSVERDSVTINMSWVYTCINCNLEYASMSEDYIEYVDEAPLEWSDAP